MTKLTKSKDFDIIALSINLKEKLMQKRFIVKPVKIVNELLLMASLVG